MFPIGNNPLKLTNLAIRQFSRSTSKKTPVKVLRSPLLAGESCSGRTLKAGTRRFSTRSLPSPLGVNQPSRFTLKKLPGPEPETRLFNRAIYNTDTSTDYKLDQVLQEKVNPLQGKLERPDQINLALDKYQFAIVGGPGYTGKTEQIDLAVPNRLALEIKDAYLKDKFGGVIPDEAWDNYDQHKPGEKDWLEKNVDRLIIELGNSQHDTITIDEADYYGINSELLVKLIVGLKDLDKKVVVVLHPDGLQNDDFLQALTNAGIYQNPREQLIETGWYTPQEEQRMLSSAGYSPSDTMLIMEFVQGNPTAYSQILKDSCRGTLNPELRLPVEKFLEKAKLNTQRMIKISNEAGDFPTLIRLSRSPVHSFNTAQLRSRILDMRIGFFETWGHSLQRMILMTSGLVVSPGTMSLVTKLMRDNPHLDQIQDCIMTASKLGLTTSIKTCGEKISYLIGDSEKVNDTLRQVFEVNSRSLSSLDLPSDKGNWWEVYSNSAQTVVELQQNAINAWPILKNIGEKVANRFPGVYIDAGPGDKYAIKGIERMKEKVEGYMETGMSEAEAVGQLTDSIRATIVIGENSSESYSEVADYLNTVLESDSRAKFRVFMNKFENTDPNANPTGYGAIHVVGILEGDSGFQVFAELQIHKEKPVLKVKNGVMHYYYEKTRKPTSPLDTKRKGANAARLLSVTAHFEALRPDEQAKLLSTDLNRASNSGVV